MSDGKDQFDRWIDEGVQRYVEAEPSLGMESRVLAGLEQTRQRRTWWRPWMIAVPAAALLAMVIGLAVQNRPQPQAVTPQVSTAVPASPAGAPPKPDVRVGGNRTPRLAAKVKSGRDARQGVSPVALAPKPAQFPAPAPASEQERLLAQLAQNRAAAQTVAAKTAEKEQEIVISGITIKPIEIPLLPGPPQGE